MLHLNTAIRNVFLKNFVSIFIDYENYLIIEHQSSNKSSSIQRSGLLAFDKMGFLSDQPETYLPFLSAFLETQMFTSFLDLRLNWHSVFEFYSNRGLLMMMLATNSSLTSPTSTASFQIQIDGSGPSKLPQPNNTNDEDEDGDLSLFNGMPINLSIFHLVLNRMDRNNNWSGMPLNTDPNLNAYWNLNKSQHRFPILDNLNFLKDPIMIVPRKGQIGLEISRHQSVIKRKMNDFVKFIN